MSPGVLGSASRTVWVAVAVVTDKAQTGCRGRGVVCTAVWGGASKNVNPAEFAFIFGDGSVAVRGGAGCAGNAGDATNGGRCVTGCPLVVDAAPSGMVVGGNTGSTDTSSSSSPAADATRSPKLLSNRVASGTCGGTGGGASLLVAAGDVSDPAE